MTWKITIKNKTNNSVWRKKQLFLDAGVWSLILNIFASCLLLFFFCKFPLQLGSKILGENNNMAGPDDFLCHWQGDFLKDVSYELNFPFVTETWSVSFCFQFSKKYGSVFTVYLGPQKVVVLTGYQTVREALVQHDEEFGDRDSFQILRDFNKGHGEERKPLVIHTYCTSV